MKKVAREIVITVLLALVFFLAIRSVVHNFEVNGSSMVPNLEDGQFIIVSKAAYWFGDPQRGDIVVFNTDRLDHGIIHRIVGMPGETVEIKRGELYINGQRQYESYIQGYSVSDGPVVVPEDHYFIVGDNRKASSTDIVPEDDIVGKAWLCYWPLSEWGRVPNYSWDPDPANVQNGDIEDSEEEAADVDMVITP